MLEWEPPDPSYGADADGNRGMYLRGYWDAQVSDACTAGHALTQREREDIEQDAIDNQADPADEYDGPDYDAEDDL